MNPHISPVVTKPHGKEGVPIVIDWEQIRYFLTAARFQLSNTWQKSPICGRPGIRIQNFMLSYRFQLRKAAIYNNKLQFQII